MNDEFLTFQQESLPSSPFDNLGCVVRMVVDSILPHVECGLNDHRKGASLFIESKGFMEIKSVSFSAIDIFNEFIEKS